MVVKAGREKWRGAGCGLSRCLSRFCRRGASVQCSVQCAVCNAIDANKFGREGGGVVLAELAELVVLELLVLLVLLGLLLVLLLVLMLVLLMLLLPIAQALGCLVRVEIPFFFPLPGATTTKTRQRDHCLSLTATGSLMELPLHRLYRLQWMGEILFSMKKDGNHGTVSTRVNQQVWFSIGQGRLDPTLLCSAGSCKNEKAGEANLHASPFPDTNSRIGEMLFATNMSCHQCLSFC